MLTHDSTHSLHRRLERGEQLLTIAWGHKFKTMGNDDRQSAATDAISDILTVMCGPAGDWGERDDDGVGIIRYRDAALEEARDLLERGFDSYLGDAEDYCTE